MIFFRLNYFLFRWWLVQGFIAPCIFDEFQEYLLIKVVLKELPFQNWIRVKELLTFNLLLYFIDLVLFVFNFFLLQKLLSCLIVSVSKNFINCKINFPKYPFDESWQNRDDNKVHETEVKHDIAVILRISPAVIVSNNRPTSFSKNLNHHVLSVSEIFERCKLCIAIVVWRTICWVWVVKYFHSNDCEYEKDKQEQW